MRRGFLKLEKNWFQKLLIPDFPNKEIIEEQLEQALLKDDFRLEVAFFDNLEYYWLILPTKVSRLQHIYTIILHV